MAVCLFILQMLLGYLMARVILLGSPISDNQAIKSQDSILPMKFQHKSVKINRSVSVPAMMNNMTVV